MINYLKNLSKKKTEPETTPVEQPKNKYYLAKYRANVSLHITYNQLDTDGYHEYRQYENIESDDNLVFLEQKNKKIKEYQETISNINEQLKDNSSEYIMVQKVFLFKKSDFVNANIIFKDNDLYESTY
jgi:predicted DNA-binding WGR domain protein